MRLTFRELGPETWPDFERLFARHGGVWGGCWCAFYHLDCSGREWQARKPAENRREKARRVREGRAHGVLAYAGGEPVGSCQFGPPPELPKVERSRAYRGFLDPAAWRITCFFVDSRIRGRGVMRALLRETLRVLRRRGVGAVEAYPYVPREGKPAPAAFLWSGPLALYREAGFAPVEGAEPGKPVVRRALRSRGPGGRSRSSGSPRARGPRSSRGGS
jgi:GNAT superfamily N-acetyltransferase